MAKHRPPAPLVPASTEPDGLLPPPAAMVRPPGRPEPDLEAANDREELPPPGWRGERAASVDPSEGAMAVMRGDPRQLEEYERRRSAYDEALAHAELHRSGRAGYLHGLAHPEERVGEVVGPGSVPEEVLGARAEALAQWVGQAEAEARSRAPVLPSGPQKRPGRGSALKPEDQAILDEADRRVREGERAAGEWPSVLSEEDAARSAYGLPLDGEARLPGPRLLTPGSAKNLDEWRNDLGNELSQSLTRDGDRRGHRNYPGRPWPDERPPRRPGSFVFPESPARERERSGGAAGPAGPSAMRTGPSGGSAALDRVAGLLGRLVGSLETTPEASPPLSCPPPLRSGGVRMG